MMSLPALLAAGLVAASLLMLLVWLAAVRLRNAGIVDVAWAASFLILVVLYAWLAGGWLPRTAAVVVVTALWSLRLTAHLHRRVMGHHPVEDSRYVALRRDHAPHADRWFFWFFQAQAVAAVGLSLPMALAIRHDTPWFHPIEWAALALWAVAFAGESLADTQLARFKADPANRGRTCQVGLWRYSRHPNYFFEWLIWGAFALLALPAPFGWLGLLSPLAMLYLLLRVTGIPAAEAASLASRGDEYRDYQRRTSAFVPWFPRSNP